MLVMVWETERAAREAAAAAEKGVRRGKRSRAVLLRGEGMTVAAVARALRCSEASVDGWTGRWRRGGVGGVREGDHGGGTPKLGPDGAALLVGLLTSDPHAHGHQATGWTVPLLRGELVAAGSVVGERTVRRTRHRLGSRGKRPQDVLGRPDPADEETKGP